VRFKKIIPIFSSNFKLYFQLQKVDLKSNVSLSSVGQNFEEKSG
jgi:hypothetical protein